MSIPLSYILITSYINEMTHNVIVKIFCFSFFEVKEFFLISSFGNIKLVG